MGQALGASPANTREGTLQRTVLSTILFAVLAVLMTAVSAWVAYDRVRSALVSEFERRLSRIAETAASQLEPALVAEVRQRGGESAAYLAVQVQLVTLRSATGVDEASLIDSTGTTLVDARSPEHTERLPSALDSLAHPTLTRALEGRPAVSGIFRRGGRSLRASLAPIRTQPGPVAGVVAVEAEAAYLPVLTALARTLAVIALVSVIAIAVLAALIIRASAAAARLERRLSRAENLAAMGQLTATLAHEIKNPLAVIRGSAERLKRLEPEAQRMADFVIDEVDRLSKTLARYLQFARGEPALQETGDAAVSLEATLELLEGEFRARRVTVERISPFAPSAPVTLDNESLKQVYLNLILNALEAMGESGRLKVAIVSRGGPAAPIDVTIADDGAGITTDTLKHIGSPFYTTKPRGSGLGLFLARRLIESAGGELEIQSQVGAGTTCVVKLPSRRG